MTNIHIVRLQFVKLFNKLNYESLIESGNSKFQNANNKLWRLLRMELQEKLESKFNSIKL